jgi:ATP-dependent DNA helicase RecG
MIDAPQVVAMAGELESDRVERTISTDDTDKFRQAICAFANDMPGHRKPGYLLVGVADDGTIPGAKITDNLLQALAHRRDDGQILPLPRMNVAKVQVGAVAVAVVEVFPADSPPVRAQGQIWIRVGPRRAVASEEEERLLTERRVARAKTFDQRPCHGATLADLLLDQFRSLYLPNVVARGVIEANRRSDEDRLASLRLFDPARGEPTNAAMLLFGLDPLPFFPGAYVQFLRFDGTELSDPVSDSKQLVGNLITQLSELNNLLPIQIQVARVQAGRLRTEDEPDYPLGAIRELALNAVLHRSYEGTNSPVRISWFTDRVEIQNPGGLYGHVNARNFGHVPDYRNPVLAEAMKALGYVDKFGVGIAKVESDLKRNGNPPAQFELNHPEYFLATVRRRE